MPQDCSELNCRKMLPPQLPVPAFQARLRLNNTDILAQPKSSPDIKRLPKQFHFTTSEALRQNIEFL